MRELVEMLKTAGFSQTRTSKSVRKSQVIKPPSFPGELGRTAAENDPIRVLCLREYELVVHPLLVAHSIVNLETVITNEVLGTDP